MATEIPVRIVESNRAGKWVSTTRASASFESPVATDELGLLLRGHNIHKDQTKGAPNRSGSAPPSMEGSFAAYDELRADPSYSTFYPSGTNLNPRHPSPTFSREKVQFAHHGEISGNDRRLASSGSLYMPGSSLSTHEEEPENDMADTSIIMLGQHTLSLSGRHKSLVNLIQEDFPRTPSPVFSRVEEPVNHDVNSLSLDSLSLKITQSPELKSGIDSVGTTDISAELAAVEDPTMGSDQLFPQNDEPTNKDGFCRSFSIIGTDSTINLHKVENCQDKQQVEFDEQDELHLQVSFSQQNPGYNIPGYQVQGNGQGANNVTSIEMQPFLHSPAVPPSLYATSAAYMTLGNSLYPNFNASGVYAPQYSGYALGSSFPSPYLTGFPSQMGFPKHFTGNPVQNLSGLSTGTPTSENIPRGSIIQNPDRYYGHHGLTIHPAYHDPFSMQYFQQFVQDPYTAQYSCLSTPGMVGSQVDSFASLNDYVAHSGSFSIPSPRNIGIPSSNYLGSPTGLGFVPQSPLGSPMLPGSPIAGVGRRYDIGFSQSSPRNSGGYGRWQGQRGPENISDHRKHTFLEELKASDAQRIDLSDIVGCIVEFSIDQHGSRFIQQKLENCSVEEKELVFKEVLPHAQKLITDVFGNYVIQKFFEHGTCEQRKELASQLSGHMLPLSLQMYGCRVIQKALEVIKPDQKKELVLELDGHILRCVQDQNGNHVIQKCIECLPAENIDFIISAFEGHVAILSTHPYGCRVIQRVLEHCSDDVQCRSIVNEILESACDLTQDQYGNYVIQHVLERGKPFERNQIISQLSGKIVQMSQHKYASNVVEKCLEFGDAAERELLIEEILVQSEDNNSLLAMMKDQFANYVVQKILEISNNRQREILLNRIEIHLDALKKYTYGKHIVTRFEQLSGEGSGTSDP